MSKIAGLKRPEAPPSYYRGYEIKHEKSRYNVYQNGLVLEWHYTKRNAKEWIDRQWRKKNGRSDSSSIPNTVSDDN